MKVRIKESDYVTLQRITSPSFRRDVELPPETGCILLIGKNDHPLNPALTVATLFAPGDGDLEERGFDGLVFSSQFLRRALLEVRRRALPGFLTVHTHPLAEDKVYFSPYDNENDPSLMENLYELQRDGVFGSLVLGRSSAAARVWSTQQSSFLPLTELVVVGEQIRSIPLDGSVRHPAPPTAIFDRATAVTGSGALATLSRMRIGVVGAGGTGSLLIELAARAGVGEIFVFDFDRAEETNLNRVLHLRERDVNSRTIKAERLRDVIAESGLPCQVVNVSGGDIRQESVAGDLSCSPKFGPRIKV